MWNIKTNQGHRQRTDWWLPGAESTGEMSLSNLNLKKKEIQKTHKDHQQVKKEKSQITKTKNCEKLSNKNQHTFLIKEKVLTSEDSSLT